MGVAFAFGLTVLTMAYAVGPISGGHFNPAVSLGLAIAGRFEWSELIPYWIAQLVGGIAAAFLLYIIASGAPDWVPGGFASNGYGARSPHGYGVTSAFLIEAILTAGFLLVIIGPLLVSVVVRAFGWSMLLGSAGLLNQALQAMGLSPVRLLYPETAFLIEAILTAGFLLVIIGATAKAAAPGFAPIAIGLALTLIHLVSIPVTNTSVNPARSTAAALFATDGALPQLWLFWAAPLVGAALGALIWKALLERA